MDSDILKALPRLRPIVHRTVKTMSALEMETEASKTNPDPSEAQKKAGNYRMGHISWHGLSISVETAKGQVRRGRDSQGHPWAVTMPAHYGFIRGAVGKDSDPLDVFVGEHPESEIVFVIDQKSPRDGKFDEHKVIVCARNVGEARAIYDGAYSPGWSGFMAITPMTIGQFRDWMKHASLKRPASTYVSFQPGARLVRKSLTDEEFDKKYPAPSFADKGRDGLDRIRQTLGRHDPELEGLPPQGGYFMHPKHPHTLFGPLEGRKTHTGTAFDAIGAAGHRLDDQEPPDRTDSEPLRALYAAGGHRVYVGAREMSVSGRMEHLSSDHHKTLAHVMARLPKESRLFLESIVPDSERFAYNPKAVDHRMIAAHNIHRLESEIRDHDVVKSVELPAIQPLYLPEELYLARAIDKRGGKYNTAMELTDEPRGIRDIKALAFRHNQRYQPSERLPADYKTHWVELDSHEPFRKDATKYLGEIESRLREHGYTNVRSSHGDMYPSIEHATDHGMILNMRHPDTGKVVSINVGPQRHISEDEERFGFQPHPQRLGVRVFLGTRRKYYRRWLDKDTKHSFGRWHEEGNLHHPTDQVRFVAPTHTARDLASMVHDYASGKPESPHLVPGKQLFKALIVTKALWPFSLGGKSSGDPQPPKFVEPRDMLEHVADKKEFAAWVHPDGRIEQVRHHQHDAASKGFNVVDDYQRHTGKLRIHYAPYSFGAIASHVQPMTGKQARVAESMLEMARAQGKPTAMEFRHGGAGRPVVIRDSSQIPGSWIGAPPATPASA